MTPSEQERPSAPRRIPPPPPPRRSGPPSVESVDSLDRADQAGPLPHTNPISRVAPSGQVVPQAGVGATSKREPSFPAELLRVTALADPVLDRLGHDPRSVYVERFWLPILGPSCLLLLRRLAAELEQQQDGFTMTTAQWAREMGVGMKGGRNGPLWRAIERGCRFGAAQRNGELLAVRRRLPPLTARQVDRLPTELQLAHAQWVEARQLRPKRPTVTKWSERRDQIGQPLPALAADRSERLDEAA